MASNSKWKHSVLNIAMKLEILNSLAKESHSYRPPFTLHGPPNYFSAGVDPLQIVIDPWGSILTTLGITGLNDDEIGTYVQEESDPIDDETEDEDNNNEVARVSQGLTCFLR
ncbi:hypothetical protein TNCV_192381 [Trichonephila clavipes]|nr:hypothetical protein TNCV_192381 [Trichonephila clavipes]